MKKNLRPLFLISSLLTLLYPQSGRANIGESYGFGSRSGALGGTGVAGPFDGFASYFNPAGVAVEKTKRVTFSAGLLYAMPSFTPINNVVTSNKFTSDSQTKGSVDTSYRPTFGQLLGGSFRLAPQTLNFSAGVALFTPIEQTAYMDSGAAFQPEYVLYRGRTQRPQIEVGLGAELAPSFFMGAGLHFGYAVTSTADVMLQTASSTSSSLRLASSLKPKATPTLGFLFDSPSVPVNLGVAVRFALSSTSDMELRNGARVFGNLAALDFNLKAASTLYYDPLTVAIGTQIKESEFGRTLLQVDYERWSDFEAPAFVITDPTISSCTGGCPLAIQPSKTGPTVTQDLWVPRIGQEIFAGKTTLRAGYSYRRSIFLNLPNGTGNLLDPPRHIFTAGLGQKFDTLLGAAVPCELDFHFLWQHLQSQTISKTSGNESGDATDAKVGAPGYEAGGNVYGGGLSLTINL